MSRAKQDAGGLRAVWVACTKALTRRGVDNQGKTLCPICGKRDRAASGRGCNPCETKRSRERRSRLRRELILRNQGGAK